MGRSRITQLLPDSLTRFSALVLVHVVVVATSVFTYVRDARKKAPAESARGLLDFLEARFYVATQSAILGPRYSTVLAIEFSFG